MALTLTLKKSPELYLEVENLTPDGLAGKSNDEIGNMELYLANRKVKVSDYFDISGSTGASAAETTIIFEGDLHLVQRIGEKMSAGEIIVKGNCGMHLGNTMTGGKITVEGDAGEWAGAMMDGGEIIINGNAGNHCASAYRGYWVGMNDGKITVKGKVGVESGSWMRNTKSRNKWPILICGSADLYLGIHNHGGTIICEGDAEGRIGADMARGQIIIKGKAKKMLASFKKIGDIKEIKTPAGEFKGEFVEYAGDYAVSGKPQGRIYLAK